MEKLFIIIYLLTTTFTIFAQQTNFPSRKLSGLTGPYLGQKPPGTTPEIFAPGIVSTKESEYAFEVAMSGNEILFMRNNQIMIATKNIDGTWNMPEIAPFSGKHIDDEPCFSPDGSKIYFMSRRPAKGSKYAGNLWVVEKLNGKWGEPGLVQLPVLLKQLHAPSISLNNTIYDDGISIIQFKDGNYLNQKNIPGLTGMYPFVAHDESYIIYSAGYSGSNGADLYISFKDKSGLWSKGKSLGDEINSPKHEGNSYVTADKKYLFFSRDGDIYWVSAKIIEEIYAQVVKSN
jgi:hypothetical protein